jgi:hypothetical protein
MVSAPPRENTTIFEGLPLTMGSSGFVSIEIFQKMGYWPQEASAKTLAAIRKALVKNFFMLPPKNDTLRQV